MDHISDKEQVVHPLCLSDTRASCHSHRHMDQTIWVSMFQEPHLGEYKTLSCSEESTTLSDSRACSHAQPKGGIPRAGQPTSSKACHIDA